MILECLPTGMYDSNTYVIGENGEGAIIDAGVDTADIMAVINENYLKLKFIILTHGHLDHICSVDELRNQTGALAAIHEKDAECLVDALLNGTAIFGQPKTYRAPEILLKDGDSLSVGGLKLEVIHTPGHTPGGICVKVGDHVFTGDTLFRMCIGRADLPGGNHGELLASIKNKLMVLDDKMEVHPGHGKSSTIGFERKRNPFLI